MTNQYGVDASYFVEKLNLVIRDIDHYKPEELCRELAKYAGVAGNNCVQQEKTPMLIDDEITMLWDICVSRKDHHRSFEELIIDFSRALLAKVQP